jgi:PAS domain S-box-containing protein
MTHSMLEARAREVADSLSRELPGAVIVVAPDGVILSWNDAATALFGYSSAAVVGRSILDTIVPPEHVEENRHWLEAATQAGSAMYESVRCREDGRRLWVDVGLKLVEQGEDGVTLVVMSERDITRIKYRRQVEALQARFRGLLEAVPDATLLVDSCGRIALVNSETERLFGYGRQELLGELVEVLVPAWFHGHHPGHRADYFADLRPRPMGRGLELAARRKDGSEFPVEISLGPVETEEGMLVAAAVRDITERRRLEEQFVRVASHDLQEPLRTVANYAQLLATRYRGRLDPDADELIGYLVDGASRMHQLITDLLAYSRLGSRGNPFGAIDCELVFARVLHDLKLAIEQAGAIVTHDTLPTVLGDSVQLGQLFRNLLGNAIKFRGAQPCRVRVRAERTGHEWTFAVCDNGIGIAPEHADRIFLIFQRLHSAAEYPGTGIGLAISKRIVERHNGRIWVDSYPGEGATFCFTLPAAPRTSHERRGAP